MFNLFRRLKNGEEVLDNTPVAVPVKFQRGPEDNLQEKIQRIIAASNARYHQGIETFQDADDFEVDDDPDPVSVWENQNLARAHAQSSGFVEETPEEFRPRRNPPATERSPESGEGSQAE